MSAESSQLTDLFNWRILSSSNVPPDLTSPNKSIRPSDSFQYDLYNIYEKEAIVYGKRRWGINLVWGDPGDSDNIRFLRKNGSSDSLKSDELIAIGVRRGGFLKYKKRRWGINIVWSKSPVFEWKIVLPDPSERLRTGNAVAIFNMVEKDFVFYDPRSYGINLKWLKDKGRYNEPWWKDLMNKVEKEVGKGIYKRLGG